MTDLPDQPVAENQNSRNATENAYEEKRHLPKYDKRPYCIYFYYLYKEDETFKIRHYYLNIAMAVKRNDLEEIATNLAINARKMPLGDQDPQPNATDWTAVFWKRKSYLIVLVDDPTYALAKNAAIEFDYTGGSGNHAFFDAVDLKIELPRQDGGIGTETVTAVACLNHMKKDPGGDDLPPNTSQRFSFKLNPELQSRFYPDDGGNNLGPPVPPPA